MSETADGDQLMLRLGGNGGRGPVEVTLRHSEGDFEMTTIATEYPSDEIQEIDLTKMLRREGYEIVEAL